MLSGFSWSEKRQARHLDAQQQVYLDYTGGGLTQSRKSANMSSC